MDDYESTVGVTTERVRGVATGEQNVPVLPGQFDRWLAEHDREVAAKAATEVRALVGDEDPGWDAPPPSAYWRLRAQVEHLADRIERGD